MIRKEEREGYTVFGDFDIDPINPREECCDTKMVCFHSRYNLGDKHEYDRSFTSLSEIEEQIINDYDPVVIKPLSLHDHSGLSISIGRTHGWDSGPVGFVFVPKDSGMTKEEAEKVIESEVDVYDKYLSGMVYEWWIENSEGHIMESICGYYDDDDAYNDAMEALGRILSDAKHTMEEETLP